MKYQNIPYYFLLNIFLVVLVSASNVWLPKILWTYTEYPIQQGSYYQLYYLNKMRYTSSPSWQIRLLNNQNYYKYLQQIPTFQGLPSNYHQLTSTQKIDFVKILIIGYYGGIWMDYLAIMTENLDWIEQSQLINNAHVENINGQFPNVLLFSLSQNQPVAIKNIKYDSIPYFNIWFIAAQQQSQFMLELGNLTTRAIQNLKFNQNYQQLIILKDNQLETTITQKQHSSIFTLLIAQILINKQEQLKLKYFPNNNMKAVQYYNIWYIDALEGPYNYMNAHFLWSNQPLNTLIYVGPQTQSKLLLNNNRYFIQLSSIDNSTLGQYFKFTTNMWSAIYRFFKQQNHEYLVKYYCNYAFRIKNQTPIAKYLVAQNDKFNQAITNKVQLPTFICGKYRVFELICFICIDSAIVLIISVLSVYLVFLKHDRQNRKALIDQEQVSLTQQYSINK